MEKPISIDELLDIEKHVDLENFNEINKIAEEKKAAYIGRGGKRPNAGRKPKGENVLKFQARISAKEKEFLNYARSHNINYDDLMQG